MHFEPPDRVRGLNKVMACLDDANFFPENPMPTRDENELKGLAAKVTDEFEEELPPEEEEEAEPQPPPQKARPARPAPPPAAPPHPDVGKIVWMACRAARPCGNNQAKITMVFNHGDFGGKSIRYKCQGCKQPFTIRL